MLSYVGRSGQTNKLSIGIPSSWRNYALVIWSDVDDWTLMLELEESWSDRNYLRFKRNPKGKFVISELIRRKAGVTDWSDESIILEGLNIIKHGPPYKSKRCHFLWPDHQNFVEELANKISLNPPPNATPVRLLVYHHSNTTKKSWNKNSGPPMAVTFDAEEEALSNEWTGGKNMLRAYPGGPNRVPKE